MPCDPSFYGIFWEPIFLLIWGVGWSKLFSKFSSLTLSKSPGTSLAKIGLHTTSVTQVSGRNDFV